MYVSKLSSGLLFAVFLCFQLLGMGLSWAGSAALMLIDREQVCMVNDTHFAKKQIPITVDGKTYFGCCESCKNTLKIEEKSRFAVDPLSGKAVDKAVAVTAMKSDHSVVYFENKKNFEEYKKKLGQVEKPLNKSSSSDSDHSGHSHH